MTKRPLDLITNRKLIKAAHSVEILIDKTRIAEMLLEWNDNEIENIINKF